MPKLERDTRELSYSYALGVFPALECLRVRPDCARRLLLHSASGRNEGVEKLRAQCAALGVREEEADRVLARLAQKDNCFAALVFDKFEGVLTADAPHVVLHHPADGGNLGTILRACLGFGFRQLALIRPAVDVFDPHVVRASMGAVFSMQVRYFDDFDAYRARFPAHTLYPFMLDGSETLARVAASPCAPYALLFGNEAAGLPPAFAQMGRAVRIPHSTQIDSLNLAMAVSIATYAFSTAEDNMLERRLV